MMDVCDSSLCVGESHLLLRARSVAYVGHVWARCLSSLRSAGSSSQENLSPMFVSLSRRFYFSSSCLFPPWYIRVIRASRLVLLSLSLGGFLGSSALFRKEEKKKKKPSVKTHLPCFLCPAHQLRPTNQGAASPGARTDRGEMEGWVCGFREMKPQRLKAHFINVSDTRIYVSGPEV